MIKSILSAAAILLLLVSSGVRASDLKLAIYPSNNPKKLIIPMQVMARYLTEQSGEKFTAIVTRDYVELSERLKNETVDIAWINPVNYIKIKAEHPALKYIATYRERNEETGEVTPYYQSFVITLKSSGISSLEDARGVNFAFTDIGSTSGYAYPNMILKRKGIDASRYFAKVFFLKRHDRVIEALVNKSIEAGAVSDGTYYTAVRKYGDIFSIIERSAPIPLDAIVAPARMPDEKILLYRKILTSMPLDHEFNRAMQDSLGWSAAGFEVRDDRFYDSMREALE